MGIAEAVRDPGGYTRERVSMYRALLVDPEEFYDEFIGTHGLRAEAILIATIGVIGSIGTMIAVLQIREEFENDVSILGGTSLERGVEMQLWRLGIEPIIYAFLFWLGLAALLYLASWVYSEDGSLYLMVKKSAWAILPLVFANAVSTIAWAYTGMTAEIESDLTGAGTAQRQLALIWDPLAESTAVIAADLLSIVFVAWVGYIAAHAVVEVRAIELGNAYRVAAVPVVVYALWTVYTAVGAL